MSLRKTIDTQTALAPQYGLQWGRDDVAAVGSSQTSPA
jgi:hypothetical protein